MSQLALSKGNAVNLRLQVAKPVFGRHSVDPDKIAKALNSGKKEEVLPILQHLALAGKATIESLQVVECIGRLLRHRDGEVCAAAAEALAASGARGQRYEEALVQLLLREEVAALSALSALGKMGQGIQAARKGLVIRQVHQCLAGGVAMRCRALRTLAELKATRQALQIHDLLQTEKVPEVVGAAVEVLAQLSSMTLEAESCFPEEFREQKLSEMLSEERLALSALRSLSFLGAKAPAALLPQVVSRLSDKDVGLRHAAALALGAMAEQVASSKPTIDALMALLKSSAPGRAAACLALAEMKQEARQSAELVATLCADQEEVPLEQLATAGTRVPCQLRLPRCAAITALGAMGATEGVKAVAQGLLDKDWEVRLAACEALAKLPEAAADSVPGLIGRLRDEFHPVRCASCRALGALRAPEALPGLAQAFEDGCALVRCAALTAAAELVSRGAEEHCHEVFKAIGDREESVRAAALRCLARHERMGEHYVSVIATQLLDGSPLVRAAAVTGLGSLGAAGRGYQDEVSFMMNDPSDMVRQAAAGALEQLGLREPLAPIKPLAARGAVKAALAPPDNKDPVEGLGQYYKSIMTKKSDLVKCGKWIDDDIF